MFPRAFTQIYIYMYIYTLNPHVHDWPPDSHSRMGMPFTDGDAKTMSANQLRSAVRWICPGRYKPEEFKVCASVWDGGGLRGLPSVCWLWVNIFYDLYTMIPVSICLRVCLLWCSYQKSLCYVPIRKDIPLSPRPSVHQHTRQHLQYMSHVQLFDVLRAAQVGTFVDTICVFVMSDLCAKETVESNDTGSLSLWWRWTR